jgi:hypothetical protein
MDPSYSSLFLAHKGKVTDKWSSYLGFYDYHFAPFYKSATQILEIGVQNGGSLEVLAKLFPAAKNVVGVDVDGKCGALIFDDPRIKIVLGDATCDEVVQEVSRISAQFDIIVDDGSHRSRDIIASVLKYFPLLKPGGLFAVEDLHCSYWPTHGGQLFSPDSAQCFLQRLTDVINLEHFERPTSVSELLSGATEKACARSIPPAILDIDRIEFRNSLCAIFRSLNGRPSVGDRRVVGSDASVIDLVLSFDGQRSAPPQGVDLTPALSPEVYRRETDALQHEIRDLSEQISRYQAGHSEVTVALNNISAFQHVNSIELSNAIGALTERYDTGRVGIAESLERTRLTLDEVTLELSSLNQAALVLNDRFNQAQRALALAEQHSTRLSSELIRTNEALDSANKSVLEERLANTRIKEEFDRVSVENKLLSNASVMLTASIERIQKSYRYKLLRLIRVMPNI